MEIPVKWIAAAILIIAVITSCSVIVNTSDSGNSYSVDINEEKFLETVHALSGIGYQTELKIDEDGKLAATVTNTSDGSSITVSSE